MIANKCRRRLPDKHLSKVASLGTCHPFFSLKQLRKHTREIRDAGMVERASWPSCSGITRTAHLHVEVLVHRCQLACGFGTRVAIQ